LITFFLQKVGAERIKREFSSFLHHFNNLFTPFIAFDLEANGSNAAYTSNDWDA
jgi:hypothetical protein